MTQTASVPGPVAAQVRMPLWRPWLAFLFGFFLQFNILIGGGEGDAVIGGYGFRALDFLSVLAVALLLIHAVLPRRVLALAVFTAIIGAMSLLRIQDPTFWSDSRTVTLALHYLAYSFSGLYLATICSDDFVVMRFCWGLIVGLLATVPIFVLQDLGYSSSLVELGLVPGWHDMVDLGSGDIARYSGLWGHPNQAGHIAALAGAAGAYFVFHRRWIPAVLVATALVTVFYYTESRGGLIAGGSVLALSLLFERKHKLDFFRIAIVAIAVIIVIALLLQIDFIAYRFEADPTAASNFSERLASTWAGIEVALANPLGLNLDVYNSEMFSASGVGTPHNGFISAAIILGMVPFLLLIASFLANCRVRDEADQFFLFLTVQVSVSFMFEQVPADYDYAFIICLLFGRAFLRTHIGQELRANGGTQKM
jgi:hypothetical protein